MIQIPPLLGLGGPKCPPVANTIAPVLSVGPNNYPGSFATIINNGSWTGSPTTYTYTWKRDGVVIVGEVSNSYTLLAGDVGKTITAFVTAHSVCADSAETATNPTGVAVVCEPVTNTVAPVAITSGALVPGTALVITNNGSWTGLPTTFAYTWKRNGVVIGGAVAATYILQTADIGTTVTAFVIASSMCTSSAETATNPTGFECSDPYMHYDASVLTENPGDPVNVWMDLSVNNCDLTPAGVSPTFHTPPDGVGVFPSQMDGNVASLPSIGNMVVFIVADLPSTIGLGMGLFIIYSGGGAVQRRVTIGTDGGGVNRTGLYSEVDFVESGPNAFAAGRHLITAIFRGASSSIRVDNNAATTGACTVPNMTPSNAVVIPNFSIIVAANTNFVNDLNELLVVKGTMTTQSLLETRTALMAKWGIP